MCSRKCWFVSFFLLFFCTFPIGNFLSEGRFWTTTLPHHTPPPIPKLSSITKTRILFVFVPKKVPVTFTKISLSEGLGYLKLHKGKVKKEGEKLPQITWNNVMKWNFFFFCVLHIFQIFPCTLGGKSKSVSFSRVYVCVKAKLTLVSFFLLFFMHLPLSLFSIFK